MHILHIIDSLAIGGAERMLVEIANATAQAGERVSVCVTRSNTTLAAQLDPRITLHVLQRQRRFDLLALRRLGGIIRQQGVDVLHVHSRSSVALVAFAKGLRLVDAHIPLLMHDHYGIELDQTIPRWLRWWGRRYVAQYVGVYPKLAAWALQAGLPAQQVTSIANALDLTPLTTVTPLAVRQTFGLPADVPVGISVSGVRPVKRIDLLLTALAQQSQPFQFLIVGGAADAAYYAACQAQAEQLGLQERVHFIGQRADIPALLRGCDFAVSASASESGPLVLIEYMAAGLPIVATQVGGIAQQTAQQHPEIFVPPNDPAALSHALATLLSATPEHRRAQGHNLQAFAGQQFRIQAVLPQWLTLYRQLKGQP